MKRGMWKRSRTPIARAVRALVYARDGLRCRYCGHELRTSELTLDHALAHSRGGADTAENLVACCRACNTRKRALPASEARMVLHPVGFLPPRSTAERRAIRSAALVEVSE